jgi:hypothetical protein
MKRYYAAKVARSEKTRIEAGDYVLFEDPKTSRVGAIIERKTLDKLGKLYIEEATGPCETGGITLSFELRDKIFTHYFGSERGLRTGSMKLEELTRQEQEELIDSIFNLEREQTQNQ